MAQCRDCKGWGFDGLKSYRLELPLPYGAGNGGSFGAEFTPMRNCGACAGSGVKPERNQ